MELKVFQELVEQIDLECFHLTPLQQEEKVIQLIDLHHFIDCYNPDIKIIDYICHPINIIEDKSIKKGILFYDLNHPPTINFPDTETLKEHYHLQELWFVFVEENSVSDFSQHTGFLLENNIAHSYNKIFIFNFFQSVIHHLK